jgi:hypothetical protein
MAPPTFTFDPVSGRYRGKNGRFIRPKLIRDEVDRVAKASAARTKTLADALRAGRVDLQTWEIGMRQEIKTGHLAAAMAAKGGREQMTPADYGRVGQLVRRQYDYLAGFATEIQDGLPLDGRMTTRAGMYASAARGTYHQVERSEQRARGFDQERNVLGPVENHCTGRGSCEEETRRGWVPIGDLIPVTGRLCKTNCKCRLVYRNSQTGEEAPQ